MCVSLTSLMICPALCSVLDDKRETIYAKAIGLIKYGGNATPQLRSFFLE